ncbi:Protein MNN4 [Escovopsis weberi]|uniref:Protein MNN4 n=1 Tax=Escovopsis weberi TaxID=150374 RepID=A0A0M8MYX7_ESCWE|nr:Protein MNN4 [Escovopsis weberi]
MKSCNAITIAAASLVALAAFGNASPATTAKTRYFHEDPRDPYRDHRFASRSPLPEDERRQVVRVLMQTYLATFRDLGVQTWLMRGSLLGWWWGGKARSLSSAPFLISQDPGKPKRWWIESILPWDHDAAVRITEADLYFLAAYHNMTTHYYRYGGMEGGLYFQLEVNPHYQDRDEGDRVNAADARWIDMASGLFIDITAARYALNHEEGQGVLFDKLGRQYRDFDIFPLRNTTFEGVSASIPFRYEDLLRSEYGKEALTDTEFNE